jgi:hypothetical protein
LASFTHQAAQRALTIVQEVDLVHVEHAPVALGQQARLEDRVARLQGVRCVGLRLCSGSRPGRPCRPPAGWVLRVCYWGWGWHSTLGRHSASRPG